MSPSPSIWGVRGFGARPGPRRSVKSRSSSGGGLEPSDTYGLAVEELAVDDLDLVAHLVAGGLLVVEGPRGAVFHLHDDLVVDGGVLVLLDLVAGIRAAGSAGDGG